MCFQHAKSATFLPWGKWPSTKCLTKLAIYHRSAFATQLGWDTLWGCFAAIARCPSQQFSSENSGDQIQYIWVWSYLGLPITALRKLLQENVCQTCVGFLPQSAAWPVSYNKLGKRPWEANCILIWVFQLPQYNGCYMSFIKPRESSSYEQRQDPWEQMPYNYLTNEQELLNIYVGLFYMFLFTPIFLISPCLIYTQSGASVYLL